MDDRIIYLFAADTILVTHALFVAFVVLGQVAIFVGNWLGWQWIRHYWFRLAHLLAIAVVVLQSWLGVICPLTIWEKNLRANAGDVVYAGSFVSHWLDRFLYYRAPEWVFISLYTLFGALVIASWFWIRPKR